MGKRVAIVQSNYIPWKGYFDLINMVDEFILLDDVQFTRRDWRNRNCIKVAGGTAWLTIPVRGAGRRQRICETVVHSRDWAAKHWKSIRQWYAKAPCFAAYCAQFEELYLDCPEEYLSRINYRFINAICRMLGIRTPLTWSMDYSVKCKGSERLVELCRRCGAQEYLSGPKAHSYLDERLFEEAGIRVRWMDYSGYRPYPQRFPPFDHHVSILDLILCAGGEAPKYMKSFA